MNHELQVQMVKRALAHIEHKTTDLDGGPSTIEIGAYNDPKRHERECEALFRRGAVAIGHASKLRDAGDFITAEVAGRSLLVVRRDDGTLGASLNVCRHRGTQVEHRACGHAKTFVCPYHAWSYDRAGTLVGIPHEKTGFVGIRGKRDLAPVVGNGGSGENPRGVLERAGLVWVNDIPELGLLEDDLLSFGIGDGHVFAERTITRDLGWKLAIDVFLEAYHLRTAHANSIYELFFDNIGLVDRCGANLRTMFPKRSITTLRAEPETTWSLRHHGNILYHLFPNTLILVEPDHAAVLHIWPAGPGRTRLDSYAVVPEAPTTEKAQRYWNANMAILHAAIDEDFAMGESIQRGLSSGANDDVVFGAFEHALTHFHGQVRRRLDAQHR